MTMVYLPIYLPSLIFQWHFVVFNVERAEENYLFLLRVISTYLILIVIAIFIKFYFLLLLVCRNMTDFYILTLYPVTLLNSHGNSNRLPTDPFRFLIWPITYAVNNDGFISLLTLLHYPGTMLNRKGDSKQLISSQIRGAKPTVAKFIPPNSRKGFFNQIILTTIRKRIAMWRPGEKKPQASMWAKKWRSTMLMPISKQTWKG